MQRRSGADRYATSVSINAATFVNAETVFLATGLGFADALAGAVVASLDPGPLFVVPRTCVPLAVLTEIDQLDAVAVTLFGGAGVLTPAVESLTPC